MDTKRFTSIIPAPNPTGRLHMGHMLNLTIQDVLCRWNHLNGYTVHWPAALDHGGISTQSVVERGIRDNGLDPSTMSKEQIIGHIDEWKNKISPEILKQMEALGLSMDFGSTPRIDDDYFGGQIEGIFRELFNKGLIYNGRTISNWCPCCRTSLGDMEILKKEEDNKFYVLKYFFTDSAEEFIPVTTKNLSTFSGDVAIVVNPSDDRYSIHIGRKVICPVTGNELEIIGEDFVDSSFCSGVGRVTPGVVAQDYLICMKRQISIPEVYNESGRIYCTNTTLSAEEVHNKSLEILESANAIYSINDLTRGNTYCRYCGTKNISRMSNEWFLKIDTLLEKGKASVTEGKVRIYPPKYEAECLRWMDEISETVSNPQKWWEGHCIAIQKTLSSNSDWCISRNLYNGNRIPINQCKRCHQYQLDTSGSSCLACNSEDLQPEERVMDMWLSCALWCFAQNKSQENLFFEKSVTVTGYDLLYLWITITIMLGSVLSDGIPFDDVIIHPVIGDEHGRKMSKSLGNTLIPDNLISTFGSDALRISLLSNLNLDEEVIKFSSADLEIAKNRLDRITDIMIDLKSVAPINMKLIEYRVTDSPIFGDLQQHIQKYNFSAFSEEIINFIEKNLSIFVKKNRNDVNNVSAQYLAALDLLSTISPCSVKAIKNVA